QSLQKGGATAEPNLLKVLTNLNTWWSEQGKPNFDADREKLLEARLFGVKQALLYTALVPSAMAVGFLLLMLVFAGMGGYRQEHLAPAGPPTGQYTVSA